MSVTNVTIVTISRNNWDYLEPMLNSVLENTDNFNLVLINNQSTEEEKNKMVDYIETATSINENPLRLFHNAKMKSFAENCNFGANHAMSEFVMFLNDDTEVMANWLDELIKTINKDSRTIAVGSKMFFPGGLIQHAGIAFHKNKMPGHIWWNKKYIDDPDINEEREFQAVTAGAMLVRKKEFIELGGFDEAYKVAAYEDIDFCLNAGEQGYKIMYCPKSEILHHESVTQKKFRSDFRAKYYNDSTSLFLERWYGKIKSDYFEHEGVE